MATQPPSNRFSQNGDENRDLSQQSSTDATDEFAPLDDGYVYVTDSDDSGDHDTEDDSLSHQLLSGGSVVEKRSFKNVIEDRNYNRAVEREQRLEEKEQQREAEIIAGIQAMRAGRARAAERERLGLPPEEPEQPTSSKKPLLIGGLTLAGLALAGGTLAFALGAGDSEPSEVPAAEQQTESSPAETARPSAPEPSFNSKDPEVNFVESTEQPVAPGQVEYVEDDAAAAVPAPAEEAPVETPEDPAADKTEAAEESAPAESSVAEPTRSVPAEEETGQPAEESQPASPSAPAPTQAPAQQSSPAPASQPALESPVAQPGTERAPAQETQTAPSANQPEAGASGTATR